jgi:hypothetical protein
VPDSDPLPPGEELVHLQRLVLQAVLGDRPLPGMTHPVEMPDIGMLRREPAVLLVDENLADRAVVDGLGAPVRVVSQADLRDEARARGDVIYVRFGAPERRGGRVRLSLELRIATRDARQPVLGLSGVQVEFEKTGGEWVAAGDPAFFAA